MISRDYLESIVTDYRKALVDAGFDVITGTHPCVPVMFYDEHLAAKMAQKLYEFGIYAVSFTYPVVPKGKACIDNPRFSRNAIVLQRG